jgi:hypothetical protein
LENTREILEILWKNPQKSLKNLGNFLGKPCENFGKIFEKTLG